MEELRLSKIIKIEIDATNKLIRRLTNLNLNNANRVKKNNELIGDLKEKIESLQKMIDELIDSNDREKLVILLKSYNETSQNLYNSNKVLESTIKSNEVEIETQTKKLEELGQELIKSLTHEQEIKERLGMTYVDLDNTLNDNLFLPSTINITTGTKVEILTDINSNTYIKIGKFNSSISGSTSKSVDYSKIIIDSFSSIGNFEPAYQKGVGEVSKFSSYTVQSFNYDISVSLSGKNFLLIDYENLITDNTIWSQLNNSNGPIRVVTN